MSATYTFELRRTIVVSIEAESESEARALALDPQEGWDGAWERAEPEATLIGTS